MGAAHSITVYFAMGLGMSCIGKWKIQVTPAQYSIICCVLRRPIILILVGDTTVRSACPVEAMPMQHSSAHGGSECIVVIFRGASSVLGVPLLLFRLFLVIFAMLGRKITKIRRNKAEQ